MGLEYITQPQVFLSPITAVNGIEGINKGYPLLTTFQSWTSTSSVSASVFPIPGNWTMLDESGSFLVTIEGILQPSSRYSVNRSLRTLTFVTPVSANVEIAVQQLATASPSAQSFNFVESVSGLFNTLTATTGAFESLLVTNLTGLSTIVNIIDIKVSEVSGFKSTGDVEIEGKVNVTNDITLTGILNAGTNITGPSASITNATITNLTGTNATITNLTGINATITNLTANSSFIRDLTIEGSVVYTATPNQTLTVAGNISATNNVFTSAGRVIVSSSTLETPTTGISAVNNIIALSESTYNALTVKLPNTYYIIV
jgi:hypothetical protein